MGSITGILDVIASEAEAEAITIAENSRQEAMEIKSSFEEEARRQEERIIGQALKKAENIRQRGISQTSARVRSTMLSAKRKAMDKAFAAAEKKLISLDRNDKKFFYERLIIRYMGSDGGTVLLNGSDMDLLGTKLKVKGADIRVEVSDRDFSGGLVIKDDDTETDCTFEAILRNAAGDLESDVAAVLFE